MGPLVSDREPDAEILRRSEERFRALVEHCADAIVLIGRNATFQFASASTVRVLGRPPLGLVGRDVFELMHPDDVPRCREIFQGCLDRPSMPMRAEFRYLHQDGSWHHYEADGVNRLEEPAIGAVVSTFRDVTERKRAEASLLESQERLRAVAEATRRANWRQTLLYEVLQAAGSELDADKALAAALEVMARRTGWKVIHFTVPSPDGRYWMVRAGSDEGLRETGLPIGPGIVGRAFLTGRTQLVPDVSLDADYVAVGAGIRSEVAVPIKRGDRTLGVLNLESERLDDFTAEDARLAESVADAVALALENASLYRTLADEHERLRSLIAATDNGILLVGAGGAVQVINETALRLLGLAEDRQPWQGKPAREVALAVARHSPDAADVIRDEAGRDGANDARHEGEYEAPGRFVRWASSPVRTAEAFLGRLVVLRDVGEERRLQRLQEDLGQALVHDLRGPLTSVMGALEVIRADLRGASQEWAEVAMKAAARMLSMIDSILEVTRLERGAMPIERRALVLPRLVGEVLDLRRPMADRKGLRLESDVPPDLPAAWADLGLVARVLENLVGNAVRFTPAGGSVRVTAGSEGESLRVTVSDTGPGIAPHLQGRLFQKFAAGDASGSGLGLAFCRLAVEAHGGRIWAESPEGGGAAFTFTIPACSAS